MSEQRLLLYRSNRIEELLTCLGEELAVGSASPLTPECIVVQSRGMAVWLEQRLAERFGVWANPDFPHPRSFHQRLLRAALGEAAIPAFCQRETFTLALLALLAELPRKDEFTALHRYLHRADDWQCLQLAEKIAYLFDQYAVYRPDMVLAWERGDDASAAAGVGPGLTDNRWQPPLWRRLTRQLGSPVAPLAAAFERLRQGRLAAPELLPPRAFLFAITTLPPLYLNLLNQAARLIPLHLLLFSPAREYWGDIFTPAALREMELRQSAAASGEGEPASWHLSDGHPLLASLGTVAREFQEILEEQSDYQPAAGGECFPAEEDPPGLLQRLQQDIVQLRPPAAVADRQPSVDDESLAIHICHSPWREVEVLQDQLLHLLDGGEFSPHDIVVMVPDIETYAPLIEAVFNRPAGDRRRIPYRIADRRPSREGGLLDALLQIFAVARGRLEVSTVLDLLALEPVRRGLGLDDGQLRRIEQWLRQSRVCWGIDEEHRRRHGQPAQRLNTWRFGLERLLLGYALPPTGGIFQDILPHGDIEGQESGTAGLLLNFCQELFALAEQLSTPRTLPEWAALTRRVLTSFCGAAAESDWQGLWLRDTLAQLQSEAAEAALNRPLEIAAFLRLLQSRLDDPGGARGFLDGGLTFCNMLPLRTIPFPVVCLLGLNNDDFPRQEPVGGFDLLAAAPRLGDRCRRRDDRFLFLEALLAARRRLYISYVGRSVRDNRPLPPSVLVDELLCCLAAMLPAAAGDNEEAHRQRVAARFTVEHPLQPFSPRYYQADAGPLFSYASEYLPAVAESATPVSTGAENASPGTTGEATTTLAAAGYPSAVLATAISLADLHDFYRQPASWYGRRQLGLLLPRREESGVDREPLEINNLERYRLGCRLLQQPALLLPDDAVAATPPWQPLYRELRAAGELPPGRGAHPALAALVAELQPLAAFLAGNPGGHSLPPLVLDLPLAVNHRLVGELSQRAEAALLRWTPAKASASLWLSGWLDHLALCAQAPADQDLQTIMAGRDEHNGVDIRILRPLESQRARELLAALSDLFITGQQAPLPFFRRAAYEFVATFRTARGEAHQREAKAWQAARRAFYGDGFSRGAPPECEDPYVEALFFGPSGRPAADRELPSGFAAIAHQIYEPLLQNLEQVSTDG
ncbi:MAG: exodeoxyribonuclease V subunit gamma [Desulfurivibrio sp.]|nr:exodeoxyribonuclease V subunit gamma [Desulfurivibrio sp.]